MLLKFPFAILEAKSEIMNLKSIFTCLFVCLLLTVSLSAQQAIYTTGSIHHPLVAENGMVATQHKLATKAGLDILKAGGNAIDAAVAVGFSLAVVLPRAGNLGGGGFMIVHDAKSAETKALNYREMAPAKSHRDMYLDEDGNVDQEKVKFLYPASGVPGSVAGMVRALELYGTMSLAEVMAPAIKQAEEGFEITYTLALILQSMDKRMRKWPETAKIFYKPNGGFYKAGEILKQKDLAWSLKKIAKEGPKAFYEGEIGERIAKDMANNGGLVTMEDLKNYKVEEMEPVWGEYKGYDICSMPPPSSGGVHIIQMLNILKNFPISYFGHNSAETIHLMAEAMKYAYADRSEHLGDPNFWDVPVEGITSQTYADDIAGKVNRWSSTPSEKIKAGKPQGYESDETTHYTVVDAAGNVVVNTYTLNFSFGTGIVAKGTGILLNNEMDDFSAKPGVPNAFGLLGGDANAVEAGKRPLSSMTPTMVFKDGKPYFATGSPGGSRIITTVLQVILNVIDHDMNVAEASNAPRIHHQWYPEKLYIEKGIGYDTQRLLREKNYEVQDRSAMGSTQTIMLRDGLIFGSSDPRRPDGEVMGY